MRKLLVGPAGAGRHVLGPAKAGHYVLIGVIALVVPLLAQSQAPSSASGGQPAAAGGQGRGGGAGGGGDRGVLGPVNALGQEVRRRPAPTGPPPRLPDGTIDLGDGIWVGGPTGTNIALGLKKGDVLPLLPVAQALMASRKEEDDPHLWCMPMGVPRSTPYPFRFVQNYTHKKPTHMFILHEGNIHSYRQIFMDGRKHPAELDPTWFGHSIGWYEKDTLVIDTVGFNDKFWFDRQGTPHTEQLHTVERWTRVDMGHIVEEVTIDDPGAFSRPFTLTFSVRLSPPGDEIMENICQENNQFGIAGGHTNPFFGPGAGK